MELHELLKFFEWEHDRSVKAFHASADPSRIRYTIFAKVVEEVGELSEAILAADGMQRKEKSHASDDVLAHEVADVIIATCMLAQELGVDVNAALDEKVKRIKERKY